MERWLWFQKFMIGVVKVYCFIFYRLKIEGKENMPKGACMVCANHTSAMDTILLPIAISWKYPMRVMAKKELFDVFLIGTVVARMGAFPVVRGKADVGAIKKSLKTIKDGEKFMIFPQGTRADAGKSDIKAGAGMIAIMSGAAIVPVHISPEKKLFGRITIRIGKPFYPEKRDRKEEDAYANTANEIMEHVYALAGD